MTWLGQMVKYQKALVDIDAATLERDDSGSLATKQEVIVMFGPNCDPSSHTDCLLGPHYLRIFTFLDGILFPESDESCKSRLPGAVASPPRPTTNDQTTLILNSHDLCPHQVQHHHKEQLLCCFFIMDDIPSPPEALSLSLTLRRRPFPPPIVLPAPTLARPLAPRSIFFTIPLRAPQDQSTLIMPVQTIAGVYLGAIDRVNNAPERDGNRLGLDPAQRSAIIALLTVLNDYHASNPLTVALTAEIASNTDVIALAKYGNLIHRGLAAFQSKKTPSSVTASSTLVESTASRRSPYSAPATAHRRRGPSRPRTQLGSENGRGSNGPSASQSASTSHSGASASPSGPSTPFSESSLDADTTMTEFPFSRRDSDRALADIPGPTPASSSRASRSTTVRASCRMRDSERCRICDGGQAVCAHIIPFSLRDGKALDFWKLVAMFRGPAETEVMKQFALEPDATNADNILNVMCLCRNCHHLYDHAAVTLVPDIDAPAVSFPYSPWSQSEYDVMVEFPGGCNRDVRVVGETDAGDLYRITPGHRLHWRTDDPDELPLPHPLLLQLHLVCSRMAKIRAAAGWRNERGGSEGGQTVWEDVEDEQDAGKEWVSEVSVQEEEARDCSAVVVAKELEIREMERRMLWAKKMQGVEMPGVEELIL